MKRLSLLLVNLVLFFGLFAQKMQIDDTLHHLYGAIGGKYGLTMNIFIHGADVRGSMYYNKVGQYIYLKGTIDNTGHMLLKGSLPNGVVTDIYDGTYNGKIYRGTWSTPKKNRTLSFLLRRTNKHWLLLDSVKINIKDSIKVSGQWVYFTDHEELYFPKAYPIPDVAGDINNLIRIFLFDNDLLATVLESDTLSFQNFKQYIDSIYKAVRLWKSFELHESYDYPTDYELDKTVNTDYVGHLIISVSENGYVYTGGAHGYPNNPVGSPMLIDLYSGRLLEWNDLIKISDTLFLQKVLIPVMRDYFKKEYNLKLEDVIYDFSDLEISSFDLGKKGMYFTINQDQFSIDSELMPMPDFFVSFDKLKPYLTDFIKHRLGLK